ncbi:MAG: ATP-dependent RNA/DNA helicase IGHMBP2 [Polyangiales bacterium]
MSPLETEDEALERLAGLWRRERDATRARFVELREGTTLRDRALLGIAIRKVRIEDENATTGGRTFLWLAIPETGERTFRPGQPVRLHNEFGEARAIVSRRARLRLGVVVDGEAAEALEGEPFAVDADAPEITFERGDSAIRDLRAALSRANKRGASPQDEVDARRAKILFGQAPLVGTPASVEMLDEALNEAQREAVAYALGDAPIALIHGPPGTGKTRTLVEVVRQLAARGQRVLVSAASNAAVDHLGACLREHGTDVLRLGHPARVSQDLQPDTLDAKLEATGEWKLARAWSRDAAALHHTLHQRSGRGRIAGSDKRTLYADARALRRDARAQLEGAKERIVSSARVILSTASGADVPILSAEEFDVVILDEATQAPDPIALVALSRAPRAVLAGDPQQLAPTVIDRAAARDGLGETFFERLAERAPEARKLLVVQHRMNEAIMAFPSASKYEGRLIAAPDVATRTIDELASPDLDRKGPVLFIDTAGKGWEESGGESGVQFAAKRSIENVKAAEFVAGEIQRLLARGISPNNIALISPYSAQVQRLRDLLRDARNAAGARDAEEVDVGSVDGFQGQEREVIVVDLVRSNGDANIGFLADTRRMNVALTRAKRLLIVVGDSATLGEHPYYRAFLDAVMASGSYRSVWEDA